MADPMCACGQRLLAKVSRDRGYCEGCHRGADRICKRRRRRVIANQCAGCEHAHQLRACYPGCAEEVN